MLCGEQRAYHPRQMLARCHPVGCSSMTKSNVISSALSTRYLLSPLPAIRLGTSTYDLPLDETLNASVFQVLCRHKGSTTDDKLEPSCWSSPSAPWSPTKPIPASLGAAALREESAMGISESIRSITEPIWPTARAVGSPATVGRFPSSGSWIRTASGRVERPAS